MRTERREQYWTLPIHCSIFLALAFFAVPAHGESALGAREHFDRGVDLAQHGDIEAAALEFEAAYQISPNYSVLYNLGQSYAALGKPVEAVRAFEKYLEVGGPRIARRRRSQVENAIALNQRRIGFLSFSVEPSGASIAVDGRSVNQDPAGRLALATGEHGVTAVAPGYEPFIGVVEITPGNTLPLQIQMSPIASQPVNIVGQLSTTCELPGVRVLLDGAVVKPRPNAPFLVSLGPHDVKFERRGYLSEQIAAQVAEGTLSRITCALRPVPNLSANDSGLLSFEVVPADARIQIDGVPESSTFRVPAGPHDVVISSSGFQDWHQLVAAQPGLPRVNHVVLKVTTERARELSAQAASRRTWQYFLAGAGASLVGASVALFRSNDQRYDSWNRDRERFDNGFQTQPLDPALLQRARELQGRAASIQRQDDIAMGVAIVGGGFLVSCLVSWLTAH